MRWALIYRFFCSFAIILSIEIHTYINIYIYFFSWERERKYHCGASLWICDDDYFSYTHLLNLNSLPYCKNISFINLICSFEFHSKNSLIVNLFLSVLYSIKNFSFCFSFFLFFFFLFWYLMINFGVRFFSSLYCLDDNINKWWTSKNDEL